MEHLFGKTLNELTNIVLSLNLPKFSAKQIADWLYKKNAPDIESMTNLSKSARAQLAARYDVGRSLPVNVAVSVDGTKKYLFKTAKGYIETAYIPEDDRHTLCVSSQVGCKMGCTFCMTGRQGFQANLTAGEIVNQMASIDEGESITNIVYMGMGEPMDNLEEVLKSIEILTAPWGYAMSPRRITVSTIGLMPATQAFVERCEAHLAISLHDAKSDERQQLMPVQKVYPIANVVGMLRRYDWSGQRRLSFEYTLFDGVNDSAEHVKAISLLLNGLRCRINIIRFNDIPDAGLKGCSQDKMERFRNMLNDKGFTATIRNSKGSDIAAACGLLSTIEKVKSL